MALLPQNLDYTSKDFDSLRLRLIELVQSVFPDWSDFDTSSFGNVLIEMYAFVGDVLTYYMDNLARESRLSTASQRKNIIALARMLGYTLHGAGAATTRVELTLEKPPSARVVIPKGTIVRTQQVTDPVRFQLLEEVTFDAGTREQTKSALFEHSISRQESLEANQLSGGEFQLAHAPFLDGSISVTANNGVFTEQKSLLSSGPHDAHVMVLVDQNEVATLRFGDGIRGLAPSGTIEVAYKTGGGKGGNVDAETLVVFEGSIQDVHGSNVRISARNPEPASGGMERQSLASAKALAPESLRAMTRSVAREDFEINARRLPSVARALMLTSNEDRTIPENSGVLYVIPRGGGLPTPALKNQVLRQVTEVYPCTLTFGVRVQNPLYRTLDIEARVYLEQGQNPGAVRNLIAERLKDYFQISLEDGTSNPLVDFGFHFKDREGNPTGEIAWSDIFNVIRDTEGVRKVGEHQGDLKIEGLPSSVRLKRAEFPVLGQITLVSGDTGGLL